MKSEDKQKKTAKPKKPSVHAAKIDEKQVVALAATLSRVSRLLVMCAPPFPDGSEGAQTVELARRSIPLARNVVANMKGGEK